MTAEVVAEAAICRVDDAMIEVAIVKAAVAEAEETVSHHRQNKLW